MHDLLRGFGTGFTIAAALALFLLTALLAGWIAHELWTYPYGDDARGYVAFPIAFFAFSAICIACCVRTRNPSLRVACLLGTGGGLVVTYFVGALFFAS